MKLYLVTRRDLPPGARATQLCHAMRQWSEDQPEADRQWFTTSNTLVLLEAANESDLATLVGRAREARVPCAEFREPDLEDALTAIAIGWKGARLVAELPKALKPERRLAP